MSYIFKRESFTLCKVDVPQGYPQSQTHSGITIMPDNCFVLTTSPYPSVKRNYLIQLFKVVVRRLSRGLIFKLPRSSEYYENPMIYFAKENDLRIPTDFVPYENNPLMDTPIDKYGKGSYCSDPDVFSESDDIYIINRNSIRTHVILDNGYNCELYIYIIHAKYNNENIKIQSIKELTFFGDDLVCSPSLIKLKNLYHFIYLVTSSYNTGLPCEKLVVMTNDKINNNFSNKTEIVIINGIYEPWHMSVFKYKERLYAIVACIKQGKKQRCYQMFGEFSDDLSQLKIYQTPLTDYKSYRGSACVREDGMFILYSTTVHEKIKGSKSVDGRDVIMANMPFDNLLKILRDNE